MEIEKLIKIILRNESVIIVGDININLCGVSDVCLFKYKDCLCEFGFMCVILDSEVMCEVIVVGEREVLCIDYVWV